MQAMELQPSTLLTTFIVLTASRTLVDLWLERLNQQSIQRNSQTVPREFEGYVDARQMTQSAHYSLARSCVGMIEEILIQATLLALVLSWGARSSRNRCARQGMGVSTKVHELELSSLMEYNGPWRIYARALNLSGTRTQVGIAQWTAKTISSPESNCLNI
jgi:hypothetical protein